MTAERDRDVAEVFAWTHTQFEMLRASAVPLGSARPYQIQRSWRLKGRMDFRRLEEAWRVFWHRHREVLARDWRGEPVRDAEAPSIERSWDESGLAVDRAWKLGCGEPYGRAPMHLTVVHGAEDDLIALTNHHAYGDGTAMSVVLKEVVGPAVDGRAIPPRDEPSPAFARFARWSHQAGDAEETLEFWQSRLLGAETGRPLVGMAPIAASETPQFQFEAREAGLPDRPIMRSLHADWGARPSTLVHTAVSLLLWAESGGRSTVFESVRSMRDVDVPGVGGMIGNLAKPVDVRVDIEPLALVGPLLRSVREWDRDAKPHAGIAFPHFKRILRRCTGRLPEVLVVSEECTRREDANLILGKDRVSSVQHREVPTYPLLVVCGIGNESRLEISSDGRWFTAQAVTRLADRLACMLGLLPRCTGESVETILRIVDEAAGGPVSGLPSSA